MDRIMATVYQPGTTNRVIRTSPNSHVDIKGGAGYVVSERDLLSLLRMPELEISYNDEWGDFTESHIAKIGGVENLKATILPRIVKAPVETVGEALIDYTSRPTESSSQEVKQDVAEEPVINGYGRKRK